MSRLTSSLLLMFHNFRSLDIIGDVLTGVSPSGGCSMSPFFSQLPMGWMSEESTSLQKSLLLSLPSRRRRRRTPVRPITVAIQTEVELRGSWASSFIPTLKSLEGGTRA